MSDLVGHTLGRYQVVEKLGEGGMATVYKAYQPGLNRFVALKVLAPVYARESDFGERFRREAQAVANLNHPNILPVFDFGQEEGYSFIAMRYVEGARTLKDVMAERLGIARIADLIGQIAAALDCAHRQGIIHRDVKPANVLMDGDWAMLSDFGLAKIVEASVKLTGSGVGVGTPAYMSPEQGQGLEIDLRSDIYSLGIILFEMLTGQIPHNADTPFAIVVKRMTEALPLPRAANAEIPEAVERVILKALARDPADRYASAGALAESLRQAVGATAAPAAVPESTPAGQRPSAVSESAPAGQRPSAVPEPVPAGQRPSAVPEPVPAGQRPSAVPEPVPTGQRLPAAPQPEQAKPPVQADPAAARAPASARPRGLLKRLALPRKWVVLGGSLAAVTALVVILAVLGPRWFRGQGLPTAGTVRVWEQDGSQMVYVPAGDFRMGSAADEPNAHGDEQPPTQLHMEAFWIGRYEVTNAQYARCVAAGACQPPQELDSCARDSYYDDPEFANYPVTDVTWHQALAYATWAGGRLPTEAEWEYAARGPNGSIYPWGNEPPTDALLNYNGNPDTTEVGSYPQGASWCGALDMAGNVWEWTQGLYRAYPYNATDGREDLTTAGSRVVRGGSYADDANGVRSAFRHEYNSTDYHCSKGFRIAVTNVAP